MRFHGDRSRSPSSVDAGLYDGNCGDFNVWAVEWGSSFTNHRGQILLEALAMLGVDLANNVNIKRTFSRNGAESMIDVTFCSTSRTRGWTMLTLTAITWRFTTEEETTRPRSSPHKRKTSYFNDDVFRDGCDKSTLEMGDHRRTGELKQLRTLAAAVYEG